jgi:hypothetical protein
LLPLYPKRDALQAGDGIQNRIMMTTITIWNEGLRNDGVPLDSAH